MQNAGQSEPQKVQSAGLSEPQEILVRVPASTDRAELFRLSAVLGELPSVLIVTAGQPGNGSTLRLTTDFLPAFITAMEAAPGLCGALLDVNHRDGWVLEMPARTGAIGSGPAPAFADGLPLTERARALLLDLTERDAPHWTAAFAAELHDDQPPLPEQASDWEEPVDQQPVRDLVPQRLLMAPAASPVPQAEWLVAPVEPSVEEEDPHHRRLSAAAPSTGAPGAGDGWFAAVQIQGAPLRNWPYLYEAPPPPRLPAPAGVRPIAPPPLSVVQRGDGGFTTPEEQLREQLRRIDVTPALSEKLPPLSRRNVHIPPGTCAVVIPAHNEQAVIAATLRSVLRVFTPSEVYVFCDHCSDRTVEIAREYLPAANVIENPSDTRGKSHGLEWMMTNVIFPLNYIYVTICDADTTMEPQFLIETLKVLRNTSVAAAVGQVKSRWYPKNLISVYRTYGYVMWQMFYKRLQSITNSVTIASGCSTTWKTRVLRELDFDHNMSTEDFSLTMQVHRKRLGTIKYVPKAKVWTQDPFSVQSYRKQMYRWDRAWWESVRRYQVGLHWFRFKGRVPVGLSVLDVSTLLLTVDIFMFIASVLLVPLMIIYPIHFDIGIMAINSRNDALILVGWQYASIIASALFVAIVTKQPRIFLYSPAFILLMYLDIILSLQALFSTIRSQYRRVKAPAGGASSSTGSVWVSPERREVA